MNVKAWKKQTPRLAKLEVCLKIHMGMMGLFGKCISTSTKIIAARSPKTSKQIIVAEFHGKEIPPNSSPKRNRRVPVMAKKAPSQSIAANPSNRGVFGVLRSRNIKMMMNAIPSSGRFMKKHHRQDAFVVNVPPRIGPKELATDQTAPIML
jgi:hypothetical protein